MRQSEREVVFIGVGDLLDDAVGSEPFDESGALGRGKVGQGEGKVAAIAEGCGRSGDRERARFLGIAAGSASEAEYQRLLAKDLAYLVPQVHHGLDEQVNEIKRMLNAFIKTLAAG